MISRLKRFSRQVLFKSPNGVNLLLRMGKISRADYYDVMSEFIMEEILESGSTCVDIGCHRGDVLEPMLRFAPQGQFYAFEPLPGLFEHLHARFGSDDRIKLFNIALSDKKGTVPFQYVVDAPAYSGFRSTEAGGEKGASQTINVDTERLDDVLGGTSIDLIKIDVEGAELQVLRGGLETIRRCKPFVLFEHEKHATCYDTKPDDIFDLLNEECGLSISLLGAFLRGGKTLSRREFSELSSSESYFLAHGRPS
jgi:FkbM family methyltransferase